MSTSVATDAEGWVKAAAGDTAGLTIGKQLRAACRALRYPDMHWRIRAAWYGEAGSWSAVAFEELRARYRALEEQQARLAAAIDEKHAALLRAGATALESGSDATVDRQEARAMRSHAEQLVARCSRDQA